jgi:hypothetical protein
MKIEYDDKDATSGDIAFCLVLCLAFVVTVFVIIGGTHVVDI